MGQIEHGVEPRADQQQDKDENQETIIEREVNDPVHGQCSSPIASRLSMDLR